MIQTKIVFLITLVSIALIQPSQAEETDQFTLPSVELFDLGPTASNRLFEVLETVVAQTNRQMQVLQSRAPHSRYSASQLELRRKGTYIADLVFNKTGPGFPRWFPRLNQSNPIQPMIFKIKPWNNVYWLALSQSPISLMGLAPTIRMYDHYFGTDKLGHFFMQGHTYYKIYQFFLAHGKTPEQAHAAIVTYGQILEYTYLGVLVNGIYSNGDLAANYAGWKFYSNLTQSVAIGDHKLPPILVLIGNQWKLSKHINRENLLKPYLSDNLNEAYNPCRYIFTREQIRKQVRKRCPDWIKRKGISQELVVAKLEASKRWHGEEYGHWLPEGSTVTLNTCFGGK